MKCAKEYMRLYAVTDRTWLHGNTLYSQVESALKGGITCLQLREKDLPFDDFLNEALEIKSLCKDYGVPFFINDNVEVAIKCCADGIHVGQHDMTPSNVRSIIGNKMMLGVSAQTVAQALQAQAEGADCLGVGAMFNTSTKLDADSVSLQTLADICSTVSIPVVAIGGINKSNILQLSTTGVDGVALVSAIFAADNIEKECHELLLLANTITSSKEM